MYFDSLCLVEKAKNIAIYRINIFSNYNIIILILKAKRVGTDRKKTKWNIKGN